MEFNIINFNGYPCLFPDDEAGQTDLNREQDLPYDTSHIWCQMCDKFYEETCSMHGAAQYVTDSPVLPLAEASVPAGLHLVKSGIYQLVQLSDVQGFCLRLL